MYQWFQRLLRIGRGPEAASSLPLADELRAAAARFREMSAAGVGNADLDQSLNLALSGGLRPLPEELVSEAAAALGEDWIQRFGGCWELSDLFGPVVAAPAGIREGALIPLAALEMKERRGERFSLSELTVSLEARLKAEEKLPRWPGGSVEKLSATLANASNGDPNATAHQIAQEFRSHWEARHKSPIPLSLVGIRELDRFLRTNYIACFLGEADLVRAGFFAGEVGRGLFGGNWNFRQAPSLDESALHFPEIDYYPVGRVFKMMTTRPEGEPLDEYLRLIPSARAEMRQQGGNPATEL